MKYSIIEQQQPFPEKLISEKLFETDISGNQIVTGDVPFRKFSSSVTDCSVIVDSNNQPIAVIKNQGLAHQVLEYLNYMEELNRNQRTQL